MGRFNKIFQFFSVHDAAGLFNNINNCYKSVNTDVVFVSTPQGGNYILTC